LALAEVKLHLKQDISDDDVLISAFLASARAYAETYCSKQFVSARLALQVDAFPCWELHLMRGPVVEIESIQYLDASGVTQTMSSTDYWLDAYTDPAKLTPALNKSWPATANRGGAVTINYKAGYVAGCTFDAATDAVTVKNWRTLAVNDAVRFSNSGGALPAELQAGMLYYVQSVVSAGVYKLSAASGGAAIDLSGAGTGLHFMAQPGIHWAKPELPPMVRAWLLLRCDTAYSHRGENVNVKRELVHMPYVDGLLDSERCWVFQ
jgi:hypothetical protein